jgi:hypothetical protein
MSETPRRESFSLAEELNEPVADPLPKHGAPVAPSSERTAALSPEPEPLRPSKSSRWVPLAALVLAVIAVAGAALGWFFPSKSASSAPTYSDQQQKDAKKQVCETFRTVERAVGHGTHPPKVPPNGGPVSGIALLTFQQFAYFGSGAVLRDQLITNPATPSELAKPASDVADGLEQLGIAGMAGTKEFAQEDLRRNLGDKFKAVVEVCKKDGTSK